MQKHILMHADTSDRHTSIKRQTEGDVHIHTAKLICSYSFIQTLSLGQSATTVLAASEGQAAGIALTKEMHP